MNQNHKHLGLCPECMSPSLQLVRVKAADGRVVQWLQCSLCQWRELRPQLQLELNFTPEPISSDQFSFPFVQEEESTPGDRQDHINQGP